MRRGQGSKVVLALLASVACVWAAQATAQSVETGTTPGGAHYRIEVPAAWNGSLVIWNHGFDLSPIGPVSDLGALAELQLSQGYAVAASSYRTPGWALFKARQDLRALVGRFRSSFGEPEQILVTGASLGGLMTVVALEKGRLGNVTGGLIWCGAVAGSINWNAALDLRLTYDAVCSEVEGASIPGGADGLPKGADLTPDDIVSAVNACTGVDLRPGRRSVAQKERLARIVETLGLREEFLQTDMWYVTFGLADLVHDRAKLRGKSAISNLGVEYPDAQVDADIERVRERRGSARRLAKFYTPTGSVGGARVVGLHTDKDDLVVVENLGDYASRLPADQVVAAVVVEQEPSHCGFSAAEAVASWEALRVWAGGGPPPTPGSIQADCETIDAAGLVSGPCRIDPDYEIGSIEDRLLPRQ